MPHYAIDIAVQHQLLITASGPLEARAIAERAIEVRYPDRRWSAINGCSLLSIALSPASQELNRQMEAGTVRGEARTCALCGRASLREDWGPGIVRCPKCHERQPTPAELQDPGRNDAVVVLP